MNRKLECVLFDLDNTLYPQSCGLMREIGRRINLYMVERLGMRPEEVAGRRDALLHSHGTTLNGLRRDYAVDPDEFLDYVHDIPLGDYLGPAPELDHMLRSLPLRRVVFTNADAAHARRVLVRLGVLGHFETVIDIHLLDFVNKPDRRAYRKALEFVSARPEACVLLEDSLTNIRPALEMGMTAVMVGGRQTDGAHYHIERVTEFARLLPELCPDSRSRGRGGNGRIPEGGRSRTVPVFG